jgi:hypothetical protein
MSLLKKMKKTEKVATAKDVVRIGSRKAVNWAWYIAN